MTTGPLDLRLQSASCRFGDHVALAGIEARIRSGEKVGVIGPSGSGKSTLLRLLGGALHPTTGIVTADGVDLARASPRALRRHRASCGTVEQGALLIPQLSVHRNVNAGRLGQWPWYRIVLSLLWPIDRARTRDILRQVGMAPRQWDRAADLSGGEQQRVAIARALNGERRVILADEPTASLDPQTADVAMGVLFNAETLVVSTHWVGLVRDRCTRIIGLRRGRILFDLPAQEVQETNLDALYAGSDERRS